MAAQTALDAADRIIAVLNGLDGCPDLEDSAEAEPSLAAPENHHASQVTWLRGNDADRKAEAPETVLPEVQASPVPRIRPAAHELLPWGGDGNVVAACGALLLAMTVGR